MPGIGSVCSGGRYDNLAELYTTQQLPGIGASLGLDRLLAAMEELGMLPKVTHDRPTCSLRTSTQRGCTTTCGWPSQLRAAGLGVEVYPEPKKLGQQLKYADRRGFRVAIIAGEQEFGSQSVQLKNLSTGESQTVGLADGVRGLVEAIRGVLKQ